MKAYSKPSLEGKLRTTVLWQINLTPKNTTNFRRIWVSSLLLPFSYKSSESEILLSRCSQNTFAYPPWCMSDICQFSWVKRIKKISHYPDRLMKFIDMKLFSVLLFLLLLVRFGAMDSSLPVSGDKILRSHFCEVPCVKIYKNYNWRVLNLHKLVWSNGKLQALKAQRLLNLPPALT
jgi:hypothetical protein